MMQLFYMIFVPVRGLALIVVTETSMIMTNFTVLYSKRKVTIKSNFN